jgi:hypothetical protein
MGQVLMAFNKIAKEILAKCLMQVYQFGGIITGFMEDLQQNNKSIIKSTQAQGITVALDFKNCRVLLPVFKSAKGCTKWQISHPPIANINQKKTINLAPCDNTIAFPGEFYREISFVNRGRRNHNI